LIQDLWPRSWNIKSRGVGAESNYLVPSPYGDIFDILEEKASIATLPLYRAAVFAGNVSLGNQELAQLASWVNGGGTAVIFASQLRVTAASITTSLVGAKLNNQVHSTPAIAKVSDLETGWTRESIATEAPMIGGLFVQAPFCVPQSKAETPPYYIKTGGDPSVKVEWTHPEDRCCQESKSQCYWFSSLAQCQAALAGQHKAKCLACPDCNTTDNGCPSWLSRCPQPPFPPPAPAPLGLTSLEKRTTATTLLQASCANSSTLFPVVLRNSVGKGTCLTVLLENDAQLRDFGILPHLLSRIALDVLPFEVMDVSSDNDLLSTKLQLLLSRRASGWQATLVNNNGVTKQPNTAAVVDLSQRLSARVRLKRAYGSVASATVVTPVGEMALSVRNNTITVTVEAGDLAVVRIELS
jgi:hypothetical protein